MAKDLNEDKYAQQFQKHLAEVDAFILVVLKSHLIMESAIDNIIRLIFFYPDILLDARMNFFHKIEVVRAYALRENEMSIWQLMHAIAELRNEVAHNLEPKKREARMAKLRKLYLSETSPEHADTHKNAEDGEIVIYASSLCTGFLGEFEKDIRSLRGMIDKIADANVPRNPDGSLKKKSKKGFDA